MSHDMCMPADDDTENEAAYGGFRRLSYSIIGKKKKKGATL